MAHSSADDVAADIARRHGIPADTYCGLSAADMSRAVVAHDSGPRRPGEPAGYWPAAAADTRLAWLREEFGPDADIARLQIVLQVFQHRVSRTLAVDWQLPNDEFDRAVAAGLDRHFPGLSADARRVIAGNYSYSHAK